MKKLQHFHYIKYEDFYYEIDNQNTPTELLKNLGNVCAEKVKRKLIDNFRR